MCDLILVRHGETTGNSSTRLYGLTDIDLSDTGREQMRRCGKVLADTQFAAVYVSPMKRARESASILLAGRGPAPSVVEDFREINFGRWEGWTLDEIAEREPALHGNWKTDGIDFQFPGGDMKQDFFLRVANAARRVFADTPSPTLAVLHKGVIKGVLHGLLGIPIDEMAGYDFELGGIHRLKRDGDKWHAITLNETFHLGDARIPHSK